VIAAGVDSRASQCGEEPGQALADLPPRDILKIDFHKTVIFFKSYYSCRDINKYMARPEGAQALRAIPKS
jgi:hypothetical protein